MKKDEARPMSRRDVVRLGLVAACGTAVKAAWPADLAPPALNWLETRLRTGAVRRLAVLFSSKESYYATHSKRAATYSIAICRVLGLNPDATRTIVMAAFLHDIGMVAVPAAILRKPSRLTEDEMSTMRQHCEYGFDILSETGLLGKEAEIVFSHHESFSGTGYPRGLKGSEIPLGARIIHIADQIAAMTEDVPAWGRARALRAASDGVSRYSGKIFDPAIAQVFLSKPTALWLSLTCALDENRLAPSPSNEYIEQIQRIADAVGYGAARTTLAWDKRDQQIRG